MQSSFSSVDAILKSEKNYVALFRAFVALMALSLVAIGQGAPYLYEKERDAYKLRFELEVQFKSKIDDIDCLKIEERKADCLFAQYQMKSVGGGVDFLIKIIEFGMYAGMLCGLLSAFGFIFALSDQSKRTQQFRGDQTINLRKRKRVTINRSFRYLTKKNSDVELLD